MVIKKYYAERKEEVRPEPMDLEMLKKIFLNIYQKFDTELYFLQATGYNCVDYGKTDGLWGDNIEATIYSKTKMTKIWSIKKHIDNYDEATLFTMIEFLYDYVSEPKNKWYHAWNMCGWHATEYDKKGGQEKFRVEINSILKDYDGRYQLTEKGEIQRIPPTGLKTLISEIPRTDEPKNIDERIQNAISKYLKHDATIADKKDAIRTLADILEFLKKEGIRLPDKDDSDLFNIINNFDIRHHNRFQKSEYNKEWYDWMFYTFLASVNVLLRLKH